MQKICSSCDKKNFNLIKYFLKYVQNCNKQTEKKKKEREKETLFSHLQLSIILYLSTIETNLHKDIDYFGGIIQKGKVAID